MALNLPNWNFGENTFNPFKDLTQGFLEGLKQRREQEQFNQDYERRGHENMIKAAEAMNAPQLNRGQAERAEHEGRLFNEKANLYPDEARALMNQQNASARNLSASAHGEELTNKRRVEIDNLINSLPSDSPLKKQSITVAFDNPAIPANDRLAAHKEQRAEIKAAITAAKVKERIGQIREIFKRNPKISETFTRAMLPDDQGGGIGTWAKLKLTNDKDRADVEILRKFSSDLVRLEAERAETSNRGSDYRTQLVEKVKANPGLSDVAAFAVLDTLENDVEGYDEYLKALKEGERLGVGIIHDRREYIKNTRDDQDEINAILQELRGG